MINGTIIFVLLLVSCSQRGRPILDTTRSQNKGLFNNIWKTWIKLKLSVSFNKGNVQSCRALSVKSLDLFFCAETDERLYSLCSRLSPAVRSISGPEEKYERNRVSIGADADFDYYCQLGVQVASFQPVTVTSSHRRKGIESHIRRSADPPHKNLCRNLPSSLSPHIFR